MSVIINRMWTVAVVSNPINSIAQIIKIRHAMV